MALMFRVMSAQCPTTQTGTTSPLKVTAIHLQVQQVIVQETIQETHTIMELARDYSRDAYNYGAGHTIHTGSRGGQYYYNSNGRKTYVPKRNLW